jgi:hypothetical protein
MARAEYDADKSLLLLEFPPSRDGEDETLYAIRVTRALWITAPQVGREAAEYVWDAHRRGEQPVVHKGHGTLKMKETLEKHGFQTRVMHLVL